MKGRNEKRIPMLGHCVCDLVEAGGNGLASLTPTGKYCLIGDLLLSVDVSSIEQVEWDEVMTNKEKADMVKSWEKSYLTANGIIK